MGVITNTLADAIAELKESNDALHAAYEERIKLLQLEIKRLKEER